MTTTSSYDSIILSGGAVKGFALLGALQYLVDNQQLTECHTFIGTSIGAILSYLICIGYSPVEVMVIFCQTNWLRKLANFDVYNVVQGSGALSYSILNEMLEKLTVRKIGKFITLRELWDEFGKKLVCCTYNYTKNQEEFMDHEDHPNLQCLTALRMSANLPLIFEPFEYNGSIYIDGGVSSNFPVHYPKINASRVIGLVLQSNQPRHKPANHIPSSLELMWKIMSLPMDHLQDLRVKEYVRRFKLVEIDVSDYFSLQFDLSKSEKFDLFSIGYNSVKNQLEKDPHGGEEIEDF